MGYTNDIIEGSFRNGEEPVGKILTERMRTGDANRTAETPAIGSKMPQNSNIDALATKENSF